MAHIFKDKKMIFSVFILPVLSMAGMLILVGYLSNNMMQDIQNHQSRVYVENESVEFRAFLDEQELDMTIEHIHTNQERQLAEEAIRNGEAELLIEFPKQFDQEIVNYQEGDSVPQVKTFFNPSEDYSSDAYYTIEEILEIYRQVLLEERLNDLSSITIFTVNSDNEQMVIQDDQRAGGKAIGTMLPYFVTLLLFAGAMGIGVDMVAGEKERGTMASLLMTPIKRASIALGKVLALMTLSGLSAVISIVSMAICMPFMFNMAVGDEVMNVDVTQAAASAPAITFTITQGLMLGGLVIAIAFLYSTIIALVSVFAKNIKEANSYIMPLYMVVMVLGFMTMFQTGKPSDIVFFIPIYNTAIVLGGILSHETTTFQYLLTLGMTIGISVALIGMIVRAFKSEKIMSV